jgi:uncharacterized protein
VVKSLQDQLKMAGLVDDKKAKELKRAKQKEEKLARKGKKGKAAPDEIKRELQQAKSEQAARDRQLNDEKNARAQRTAAAAAIKQLIEANAISQGGDKKYSFADTGKIKQLWVSGQQVDQLGRGQIAIVRHAEKYALVPSVVADKIMQRDPQAVVSRAEQNKTPAAEDPYADYQIPDDLDW